MAVSEFEDYWRVKRDSWTRKARQPRPQGLSDRRFVRTETVRYVMAATRGAMLVF